MALQKINPTSLNTNQEFVFGNLTASNANISGNLTVANITVSGTVSGSAASANTANYAGNITVNAQPNITSVGTLTSLDVTGNANVGNLRVSGNIVDTTGNLGISTTSNGNILITPNGTGYISLSGLKWPTSDGVANNVLKTDGAGNLSWGVGGGGGTTAIYVKTYYWKGALVENVGSLRHYVPVATATINTINAYLTTAGLTQSTMVVKKNGTTVNTITFAANATSNLQSGLSIAITSADYLTVDITQSSSASDLYINFIYQG